MRSYSSAEKAFKSKAKHFSSILELPLHRGYHLFSIVLGYRDFHAAQQAGLALPELPSRLYLYERIRKVVAGVSADKINQVVDELNLMTTDRALAQLHLGRSARPDVARYFSPDGGWSEAYKKCLNELTPVFEEVHALSKELGAQHGFANDLREVIAGLANLSRDDRRIALDLLTPSYQKYPDFLPLATAMLVLHSAGNRRSVRVLSNKVLAVVNGMLAHVAKSPSVTKHDVDSALKHYGVIVAAAQRRMGSHDVCVDLLCGIAGLYQGQGHLDTLACTLLMVEAAWSALFGRRFDTVLALLAALPDLSIRSSYGVIAIEAVARTQLGDKAQAGRLVDTLLCSGDVRMGLGLSSERFIPRRRPETLACDVDYFGRLDGPYGLDRLRYLDLAAFPLAHEFIKSRETRMLQRLASSELLFKEIRFFPTIKFDEPQARKWSNYFASDSFTPAVLRFGPASDGKRDVEIVVIRERLLLLSRWSCPPQLSEAFPDNAYLVKEPAKRAWLMQILESGYVEALEEQAGVVGQMRLDLRGRYHKSPALARDEQCFDVFCSTERTRTNSPIVEATPLSPEFATQLAQAFQTQLFGHLNIEAPR